MDIKKTEKYQSNEKDPQTGWKLRFHKQIMQCIQHKIIEYYLLVLEYSSVGAYVQ